MVFTILKRIGGSLITLLLASLVLFVMIRLAPGDPIMLLMGQPGDLGIAQVEGSHIFKPAAKLDHDILVQSVFRPHVLDTLLH